MAETIFARIVRGEVPCHRVYDDPHVLAFLDINPLSRGHTLVIPKEPAVTLDQLSDDAAAALGRALPRICRGVLKATGAKAYNVLQNNGRTAHQAVMHVHFHVIPRYDAGGGAAEPGLGLELGWRPGSLDPGSGVRLAGAIAREIGTPS